jgi:hypothetical protein
MEVTVSLWMAFRDLLDEVRVQRRMGILVLHNAKVKEFRSGRTTRPTARIGTSGPARLGPSLPAHGTACPTRSKPGRCRQSLEGVRRREEGGEGETCRHHRCVTTRTPWPKAQAAGFYQAPCGNCGAAAIQ